MGGVAGQVKIANMFRSVKGGFGHPLPLTCEKITMQNPGFADVADRVIQGEDLGVALIVALAARSLDPAVAGTREASGSGVAPASVSRRYSAAVTSGGSATTLPRTPGQVGALASRKAGEASREQRPGGGRRTVSPAFCPRRGQPEKTPLQNLRLPSAPGRRDGDHG